MQTPLQISMRNMESSEPAIQEAFDAAGRRLQDYARRMRGDTKRSVDRGRGTVTQLFPFEGYGFLTTGDGREVYFHRHSVLDQDFDRLQVGSIVRFAESERPFTLLSSARLRTSNRRQSCGAPPRTAPAL